MHNVNLMKKFIHVLLVVNDIYMQNKIVLVPRLKNLINAEDLQNVTVINTFVWLLVTSVTI